MSFYLLFVYQFFKNNNKNNIEIIKFKEVLENSVIKITEFSIFSKIK